MSMRLRSFLLIPLFSVFVLMTGRVSAQHESLSPEALRQLEHQSPQWLAIEPHLPDPATASADKLEMAGDVLRARRFSEDAMDFYQNALRRGGREISLLNKIGVTELELQRMELARAYFKRVVKLKKNSAEGWNNLGAVEYMDRHYGSAISDYNRAIKLDGKMAVYHSNLGTAYLEQKNFDGARKQFNLALTLDPEILEHRGTAGVVAHVLTSDEHARFCFEMARLYAERGDVTNLLHYLTMSSEGGFDVLGAMGGDPVLTRYRKDPRVLLLVQNARALRSNHASVENVQGGIPPLPPAQHE